MKLNAFLVTFAIGLTAIAAAPAARAQDQVYALDTSGPRPAISISVGGRPAENWIFDTGAGGSVIEIERARSWGLPNNGGAQIGSPIGGPPVEGFRTAVSNARAGETALPDFNAVAMPFPAHLGAGVLSPYAFRGQLVTLDFARGELHVREKNAANTPTAASTPYSGSDPHRSLPTVPVRVGEQTLTAHLDTGAPHVLVFPYSMAASLPLEAEPARTGVARFVDGERARYTGRIRGQVQVGPITLTDPEVGFIEGLPFLNVGMALLRQMTVTLDPEARVSWAEAAE